MKRKKTTRETVFTSFAVLNRYGLEYFMNLKGFLGFALRFNYLRRL
jgi:hypothetical protein